MIKKFCLLLAVISAASISMVSAQQTAEVTASGIGYLQYLPQGYHSNSNKYPLVISLHGIKEKGTSSNDRKKILAGLEKVDNVGLPKYVRQGKKYPFILISPQLKSNQGNWSGAYVMQVVNHVKKELRIDDRRIYLTGLSLGGFGVWKTAGDYPHVFAAIAPICPGGNALKDAKKIASENLPIWGFHGSSDKIVSHNVTLKMINAVNSSKPKPLAKATIFPGMGHIIWDKAYHDTKVLDWMLSQRRGSSSNWDDDRDDDDNDRDDDNDNDRDDDDDEEDRKDEDKEDKKNDNKNSRNTLPRAYAGPDRVLTLPADEVTIQANTSDKDGKIVSYEWSQTYGKRANISGGNSDKVRISNLKQGSHIFRLRVTDNDGGSHDDFFKITVKEGSKKQDSNVKNDDKPSSGNKSNVAPKAWAGPDRVITLPVNAVDIRANVSDKDGRIVSYEWSKAYGNRASISGGNSSNVRIHNLNEGVYIFRLRVKDNDGAVKDDYFKITVKGKNKGSKDSGTAKANDPKPSGKGKPRANAGPDVVVKSSQRNVQLRGSANASGGKIVSYRWKVLAGPGNARISNANNSTATVSNLKPGRYYISLTVKDENNATHEDKMALRVTGS